MLSLWSCWTGGRGQQIQRDKSPNTKKTWTYDINFQLDEWVVAGEGRWTGATGACGQAASQFQTLYWFLWTQIMVCHFIRNCWKMYSTNIMKQIAATLVSFLMQIFVKNVVQSYFFSDFTENHSNRVFFLSPADLCKVVRACLDNRNTLHWFLSLTDFNWCTVLLPELLAYYPQASQPTMAPCEVSHSFQNVTTDFLSNNPQDFTRGCWW